MEIILSAVPNVGFERKVYIKTEFDRLEIALDWVNLTCQKRRI